MFERIPLLRQSEMFKRVVGNLFADIWVRVLNGYWS